MDICIFAERPLNRNGVIVSVKPIGGLRMIDKGQADDKIIATLVGDDIYSQWQDLSDMPEALLRRLRHYFLTYKEMPGGGERRVEIAEVYDRAEALATIQVSMQDYRILLGGR